MNVKFDQLREITSYRYGPREFEPAPEPFRKFVNKEFSGQQLAELFHENTKHRDYDDPRKGLSIQTFLEDDSIRYATAKIDPDYPGTELVSLPEPRELDMQLETALASRRSRRSFTGDGISKAALSTLLSHSFGTTGSQVLAENDHGGDDLVQTFRAYPSGGALYPVEHYVFVPHDSPDLDSGVYYYTPKKHALRVLQRGSDEFSHRVEELFLGRSAAISDAAAIVCMTGNFWRSMAKYDNRGYRLVLQEAGHAGQNLLLVAEAMGLGAVSFDGFNGTAIEDVLDIDGVNESAIYSIAIGHPQETDDD